MRDFKGMKRQRNRGRGGGGGSGGGKPQHNANRAFDSNGPDGVKVRGAAQHIYEKYQQLARDAGSSGDRVLAENYLQHAEHYFRVLRAMQPQRPVGEIIGRDQFASGYDIDFEDEGQSAVEESAEAETEANGDGRERSWQQQGGDRNDYRQRDDRQRDDRQRDDRDFRSRDDRQQGEFRQRDDRYQNDRRDRFNDRPRDDRPRDDRQRDDRQRDDRPRDDRPRDERPRDERPRDDRPRERLQNGERQNRQDFRGDRPERSDPLGVIEPQATPLPTAAAAASYDEPEGGVLRGEDGAMSHAPAFLQPRAEPRAEADEGGEARRPRRRRAPRSFEADEAAPAEVDEG
jgi:hypothetical protein